MWGELALRHPKGEYASTACCLPDMGLSAGVVLRHSILNLLTPASPPPPPLPPGHMVPNLGDDMKAKLTIFFRMLQERLVHK